MSNVKNEGEAVDEVAKEKTFFVRLGIVDVDEVKYLKFNVGADDDPNRIMSESKKMPPLTESFSPGVEVPNPTRSVVVVRVTLGDVRVQGEGQTLFWAVQIL